MSVYVTQDTKSLTNFSDVNLHSLAMLRLLVLSLLEALLKILFFKLYTNYIKTLI